ncbi:polysaccharide deacetylase family protein [Rhodoferax sp.]|uniref:polysaccharide deacetylase family protein n=1 Tax=Rhodoferax sp. TaxID=50421 RepID=UPI00274B7823|nr:polysaccharide deacetylase family protein [Rhodoferax sp.]
MTSRVTANKRPIPILTYHQIDEAPPRGAPFRSLVVSPSSFARHMAMLKLLGYRGLSMSDLIPYLTGERTGKVAGITFDDGYLNNLTHALPVLRRHGFTATCYAVSQCLGQTNRWDAEQGVAQTRLMDAAQLRLWVQGGQEVGAHTRHHVHLPGLSATQSQEEIAQSRVELELASGAPVRHFCYPYGQYLPEHTGKVTEAGMVTGTTTHRGRCASGADLLQLPRVPVLRSTSMLTLWLKFATAYEDRRATR